MQSEENSSIATQGIYPPQEGMTLRDYFAGQTIIGLATKLFSMNVEIVARDAYFIADAMMRERDRQDKS